MSHSHNIPVKLDGYQQSNDSQYFISGYVAAGDITSAPIKIARKDGFCLQFTCPATGSPVGVVKLQLCNDSERVLDVADSNLVNWLDIQNGSSAVNGASNIAIEDRCPEYRWLRVVYTRTSGSITATINLHTKQIWGNSQ